MEDGLVQSVWEARAGWRCFLDGLEGLKEAAGREPEILAEVFQEVTRDMYMTSRRQLRDRFGIKGCFPGEVEIVDQQKASEAMHVFVKAWNGDLVGENQQEEPARETWPVISFELVLCLMDSLWWTSMAEDLLVRGRPQSRIVRTPTKRFARRGSHVPDRLRFSLVLP
jgi:hypothetical protein